MIRIIYRTIVRDGVVLLTASVLATLISGLVYAAPMPETEQAAVVAVASAATLPQLAPIPEPEQVAALAMAPAPTLPQLPPMSKEEGRKLLLSMLHHQLPIPGPMPEDNR